MSRRWLSWVAPVVLVACGAPGPRDDDQAKLPVERDAVEGGGSASCGRPLPRPEAGALPGGGAPFVDGTVWFARDTTVGSDVRRAYAPAAGPDDAAEELVDRVRAAGLRIEGDNSGAGRATVTYGDADRTVDVVITLLCDGYVELAYHFPLPGSSTPTR